MRILIKNAEDGTLEVVEIIDIWFDEGLCAKDLADNTLFIPNVVIQDYNSICIELFATGRVDLTKYSNYSWN